MKINITASSQSLKKLKKFSGTKPTGCKKILAKVARSSAITEWVIFTG
jgi:hypothetical protein